jgi:hypothetical protein
MLFQPIEASFSGQRLDVDTQFAKRSFVFQFSVHDYL